MDSATPALPDAPRPPTPTAPAPPAIDAPLDDVHLAELVDRGWTRRAGFLGPALATAVRDEAQALRSAGALHPAGLGRAAVRDADIRGDEITWLSHHPDAPALASAWTRFGGLRAQLNRTLYLGLNGQEIQVACYPGDGAGYSRHVDALPGSLNRRVTAICYLNPDWHPGHGGQLRLWADDAVTLHEPVLDSLLVFFSDRIPHQVEPTFAERWAVTAWLRTTDPTRPAL